MENMHGRHAFTPLFSLSCKSGEAREAYETCLCCASLSGLHGVSGRFLHAYVLKRVSSLRWIWLVLFLCISINTFLDNMHSLEDFRLENAMPCFF